MNMGTIKEGGKHFIGKEIFFRVSCLTRTKCLYFPTNMGKAVEFSYTFIYSFI